MTDKRKKILVTGGTGLVGSHLLYSLILAGEYPRAICRKTSRKDFVRKVFGYYSPVADELFKAIEWMEADILDYESLKKAVSMCDRVYHCAAIVSFDSSQNEEVIRNNSVGTANIVKACIETGVGKLCHVSST
ncbi:MAG TPA: NAD-dependent epimerase/dehydratase family protein, partial [Bacteroidales bacterium]|nr:NAD-dependent epimerase/dehydratase family protein [Bacteroidales bacterium]